MSFNAIRITIDELNDKSGFRVTLNNNGKDTIIFLPNNNGETKEDALSLVTKNIQKYVNFKGERIDLTI